jgi:hypothetical protein
MVPPETNRPAMLTSFGVSFAQTVLALDHQNGSKKVWLVVPGILTTDVVRCCGSLLSYSGANDQPPISVALQHHDSGGTSTTIPKKCPLGMNSVGVYLLFSLFLLLISAVFTFVATRK